MALDLSTYLSKIVNQLTNNASDVSGALQAIQNYVNGNLDGNARVAVRKNTGGTDVGKRRRLNFVEGSNVTLTVTDDPAGEEVNIAVAASGVLYSDARYSIVYATRTAAAGSGSQSITGAGFTPKGGTVFALVEGTNLASWGVFVGTTNRSFRRYAGTSYNDNGTALVYLNDGSGNMNCTITSLDSDGMTINWTKEGTGHDVIMIIRFDR